MTVLLQRLCWNSNSWRGPTGERYGKEASYVGKNGWGLEEWNFNTSDLIDNRIYGYIYYSPPSGSNLWNKPLDIYFYSLSIEKKRYLVGYYKNATFLSETEKANLAARFSKSNLLDKRIEELLALRLPSIKSPAKARSLLLSEFSINVSVKPEDIYIIQPPQILTKSDIEGRNPKRLTRYTTPVFLAAPPGRQAQKRVVTRRKSLGTEDELIENAYVRYTKPQRRVIRRTHNQLSNRFRRWLRNAGSKNVRAESKYVDVMCTHNKKSYLFELKSCYDQSVHHAIREALGQLLEYAYYPGRQTSDCLGIVVDAEPDPSDIAWFRTLERKAVPIELYWLKGTSVFSP
ncbi:MAG: hypothetical protein ACE5GN_02440, partial [Waddliaceae bacterium]